MLWVKRLFGLPPNPLQLKQQHDVPGLIAALEHPFPWIRRDAAQMLGHIKESRVRAPLTAALNDRDSDVRRAVQDALDQLNVPAAPQVNVSEA
jgi:HEAT repeat protein